MSHAARSLDATQVLTIEEIAKLASEGGKPADTLNNLVALIGRRFRTDVCSAYLLEPDRANLVLAATLGLRRQCIGTLRMGLNEGLAGLVAEQVRPVAVEQVKNHPRFKYFSESGEDAFQSFLGVPVVDRGVLQGVLVLQTGEPREYSEVEIHMLVEAASEVAPVVSEARTLARFIAPTQERLWALARNLWWSWDQDSTSLFRDLAPARFRQLNQNPIALLTEIPLPELERRAAELTLHSRINYAYRRPAGISEGGPHVGRGLRGRAASPSGSLFFGGVRAARIGADLFGWAGRAGGRSHQERVRSGYPADGHRAVLRTGLFSAAAGFVGMAERRISADGRESFTDGTGDRKERRAGGSADRYARRFDPGQSLADEGRSARSAAARFERGRQCAGRPGTDVAALWR